MLPIGGVKSRGDKSVQGTMGLSTNKLCQSEITRYSWGKC